MVKRTCISIDTWDCIIGRFFASCLQLHNVKTAEVSTLAYFYVCLNVQSKHIYMHKLKLVCHGTGWILEVTTEHSIVQLPVSEDDAAELGLGGVTQDELL